MMKKTRGLYSVLVVCSLFLLVSAFVEAASPRIYRAGKLADRVIAMPFAEYQNWMGHQYTAFYNAPLGVGGKYQLLINSPPLSDDHRAARILVLMRGTAESHIDIHEAISVSNLGSSLARINHSRLSSNISKTTISLNPTITLIGAIIHTTQFGSGPNVGGSVRDIHEFTMQPNTLYLVNATSDAATNNLSILLDWYEIREGWE